jgi:lipopolysaccharide transport system ATP-binding protein
VKPILEIQNISKKFRINHEQQPYLSLRDSLASIFRDKSSKEDFWALKDVSFNVMPGDTVGIIGKNGAGKSTLLKILSKITPPTSGKIISRGRIASLLEVGTGFHPELTGRENIYMNGSILGMRRKEIQKNFDAIVDFSGVEKFLDTPLKHYSSGMQLRLAFAVAAFLENEILIIDEVLAVGDAEFQKKCLGKMEDVSKSGRTVLFVSHDANAISKLTKKCAFLDKGSLNRFGETEMILKVYSEVGRAENTIQFNDAKEIYISDFYLNSVGNSVTYTNNECVFYFNIRSKSKKDGVYLGFGINDLFGRRLITPFSKHYDTSFKIKEGDNIIKCEISELPLKPSVYNVEIYLGDSYNAFDYYNKRLEFEVLPDKEISMQRIPLESQGYIMIKQKWS